MPVSLRARGHVSVFLHATGKAAVAAWGGFGGGGGRMGGWQVSFVRLVAGCGGPAVAAAAAAAATRSRTRTNSSTSRTAAATSPPADSDHRDSGLVEMARV